MVGSGSSTLSKYVGFHVMIGRKCPGYAYVNAHVIQSKLPRQRYAYIS